MKRKEHYKVGLVLSGGGFRGAAHIGVIKALEEAGIHPDVVSGVSAGALVGACYAAGLSTERMLELFSKPKIFSLAHYSYNKPGLLDTDKFVHYLNEYIPQSAYEELNIPLYICATNMLTGKLVTFHSGELNKPILASCAFPFVFSPVWLDGQCLSDGGIINNFPVEPLIGKCQKIIGECAATRAAATNNNTANNTPTANKHTNNNNNTHANKKNTNKARAKATRRQANANTPQY
ncbi:MAG: patatin-like phospholipase family protein [Saprospiraceae bacterium]|nr:patatin-like phospholipase family protein [Saprospiraceae bacterium]